MRSSKTFTFITSAGNITECSVIPALRVVVSFPLSSLLPAPEVHSPTLPRTCGPMKRGVSELMALYGVKRIPRGQHLERDLHSRSLLRQRTWGLNCNRKRGRKYFRLAESRVDMVDLTAVGCGRDVVNSMLAHPGWEDVDRWRRGGGGEGDGRQLSTWLTIDFDDAGPGYQRSAMPPTGSERLVRMNDAADIDNLDPDKQQQTVRVLATRM